MARDHERTNLDIWGDDDWLDLSPEAQHLYFVLKTDPNLTYCGSGEWHPGRIAARAKGWTAASVETAAAELSGSAGIFVIVDPDTNEYLLRSWIKHDGLWRIPNMSVSMVNARAALASRTLRGVVVHEVKKLAKHFPEIGSWDRPAVQKMLSQRDIDPAELEPFTPSATPGVAPAPTPDLTPAVTPQLRVNPRDGVNPPANPGPTPSPAPLTPTPTGGYVTGERHQHDETDPNTAPSAHCPGHPNGTTRDCRPCRRARERREAWDAARHAEANAAREARKTEIRDCPHCDRNGWALDPDTHEPVDPATRCTHHDWGSTHA